MLTLFFIVIGGLYTGWFTPTEAAGVGAFGALVITLVKRRLTWSNLTDSLAQTTRTTSMVFLILIGAHIFGYFLTLSEIPEQLSILAPGAGLNRYLILSIIILMYIVLGCFMEGGSLMIRAGRRHFTLKPSDLDVYQGERGRRGRMLPRGFQRVETLEVV